MLYALSEAPSAHVARRCHGGGARTLFARPAAPGPPLPQLEQLQDSKDCDKSGEMTPAQVRKWIALVHAIVADMSILGTDKQEIMEHASSIQEQMKN